jgi:hypothetical protein
VSYRRSHAREIKQSLTDYSRTEDARTTTTWVISSQNTEIERIFENYEMNSLPPVKFRTIQNPKNINNFTKRTLKEKTGLIEARKF